MHRLTAKQWLPIPLNEAWDFFSVPGNLNKITPDDMSFEIISGAGERTYAGQLIRYKIRPMFNIPLKWVTEITQCEHQKYFIDEQRFGPYKFWHHQHHFEEHEGGTMMSDILHYGLPGGALGDLLGGPIVHPKVKGIFSFREQQLSKLFPGAKVPN